MAPIDEQGWENENSKRRKRLMREISVGDVGWSKGKANQRKARIVNKIWADLRKVGT